MTSIETDALIAIMFAADLVPFDHTYILYHPEDALSLPLAIWSLFPILILVFLFTWFLLTREIEPCLLAAGQVINDITSGLFKKLVKYERPINGRIFKQDGGLIWGMPSSHSQFMAFWSTYVILTYIYHYPPKCIAKLPFKWCQGIGRLITKIVCVATVLLCVSFVVASRLYFEYHNYNQVTVGLLLGSLLGSIWYLFVSIIRDIGVLDWVLHWKIADMLLMKDSYGKLDVLDDLQTERSKWLQN